MNQNHHWLEGPAQSLDHHALQAAEARQAILTKPPGALGRLEEIALQLAAWQGKERPQLDRIQISVFAGDHGVAREGVSAFPQSVTAQMIANMAAGGAAISVLAKAMGASLELVNLGTVSAAPRGPGIRHRLIAAGTANLLREPAMSAEQCAQALVAGRESVESAAKTGAQLFIGGEMGIGNTTAATALACALLDRPASDLTGPGTGLDSAGITHKIAMIDQALALHRPEITNNHNPELEALRRLGGLEIAALTGASIACAQAGIPVLVDGFISSVAALAAIRLNPGVAHWMLLAHVSAEPGHRMIVEALGMQPLLDLGMRLGEGSGAAVAVSLLRSACVLHNDMATFADAGVSRH